MNSKRMLNGTIALWTTSLVIALFRGFVVDSTALAWANNVIWAGGLFCFGSCLALFRRERKADQPPLRSSYRP